MIMDQSGRMERILQEGRDRFAGQLPEKLAEIETGCAKLSQGTLEPDRVRSLFRRIHNLAGSAGTFGLPEVGAAARDLESLLAPLLRTTPPPPPTLGNDYPEMVRRLRQTCREVLKKQGLEPLPHAAIPPAPRPLFMQQRPLALLGLEPPLAGELSHQLGFFGFHTRNAATVADLLPAAGAPPPLAILLDAGTIANKDIGLLRNSGGPESVPLIFLTDLADFPSRLAAVRAGCVACFSEPIDLLRLVDVLDGLLETVDPEPFRVLIVDDDRVLTTFFATLFRENGIETVVVSDPMTVLEPLERFSPDVILMDLYMPGCSGFELARVLRLHEDLMTTPILFLSQETVKARQLAAMSLGGDDFLSKPVAPEHLLLAVTNRIKRSRDLHAALSRDGLTGLLNHTVIKEKLAVAVDRAARNGTPLTYIMIAIDRFQVINGAYGYQAGDRVLKNLARLLKRQLRSGDLAGRYGGDRFAVILPDRDEEAGQRLMEEIQTVFSRLEHQHQRIAFKATLSWGLAAFPENPDPFTLGDAANRALNANKKSR